MPAWTGSPERVANMTGAAAEALEVLGPTGVLAELDPTDWVTPLLQRAWYGRSPAALVAELRTAAEQAGPTDEELRELRKNVKRLEGMVDEAADRRRLVEGDQGLLVAASGESLRSEIAAGLTSLFDDIVVRAVNIAASQWLQERETLTTMEKLLQQYRRLRRMDRRQ